MKSGKKIIKILFNINTANITVILQYFGNELASVCSRLGMHMRAIYIV